MLAVRKAVSRREQYHDMKQAEARLSQLDAEYMKQHSNNSRYIYQVRGGGWVAVSQFLGKYNIEFYDSCPC